MQRLYVLFLFLVSLTTYSQDVEIFKPNPNKNTLEAMETSGPIKVDGVLDEADWAKTKPHPRFTQVDPYQGEAPNHDTEIKVLFDEDNLYFGIFCKDSLGKKAIRATDFKRDFNFRTHDLVTLCFDGFNDERNAMSIVVNPYGVQRDYLSFDAMYYDIEWDGRWTTRTTRTDQGWIAEIAIPWKTLRYPKTDEPTQNWGFQLYRNRRLTNEITAFSPFPRSFSAARMDYAGRLTNLKPPPPTANIQVKPYLLTSYNRYKGNNPDIEDENTDVKAGGEFKWAVDPNNVLDITVNTDFAQADVDRQVNNISRFSVFFPERRQFFLENASLFGINVGPGGRSQGGSMVVQPFFSRSIGLDNEGNPLPIDVGGRFVHRASRRNYGGIYIRQAGNSTISGTNFLVGRYSENFGKQNRIGALVTAKNGSENTNITGTVDAFIRLGEPHSINALLSYSGNTEIGGGGFSGIAQYYYTSNKWKAWWTQSVITKDFNPEMGFVSRSDVIGTTPGITRFFRGEKMPFKQWLRAYEPSVHAQFYHQASTGKLIERQLTGNPLYLNLQNGGNFGYEVTSFFQNLTETFTPLGLSVPMGEYDYVQHSVFGNSDPSKKLNFGGEIQWGSYFDGDLTSYNAQVGYSPLPHISLGGSFNRIEFDDVGTGNISKKVDLFSLESRLALNPRVQLSGFLQKNTENDLTNINIRFSWEYSPLSFVYLVFNDRDFNETLYGNQTEQQAIVKINFLKQF